MATPVEQIKERLSVIDVVGSYVQLQKAGRHFKGKSPFTNEKTPSFFVSPDRGMYYCFSSGKGGDIFSFIQEMEGVDFKGALKILAERAHVELTPENPQKRTERETLYAIIEAANVFFEENLRAHPDISAYLKKRGVLDQSIAKWRIGYVPDEWRSLKDHLTKKGFSDEMLVRSGLVKRSEEGNSLYDVFRGRVMFPICDPSGRVLAFSGRTMSSDPALPKYVNSPETELYEKSHTLFGYHLAKQSIRTHNFSLVVEGQFDLVLAHQAGFTNTVAISGTALSEHHCALLERLSKRVVLALDADRAGINSVKRSAHIMLARGLDVKVATLPEGKDPADLVAEDPVLLKNAIRNAKTVVEFLIGVLKHTSRDERSFRLTVRDEVLPFVLRIPDRIDREYFEQVVSEALGTTKDAVHFEVERLAQSVQSEPSVSGEAVVPPSRPVISRYRTDELTRYIYSVSLWADTQPEKGGDEIRRVLEEVIGEDAWRTLADMSEEEKNGLMFKIEREGETLTLSSLRAQADEYIREVRVRTLKRRLGDAREKLREAEAAHDDAAISAYLAECSDIQKRLSTEGETR